MIDNVRTAAGRHHWWWWKGRGKAGAVNCDARVNEKTSPEPGKGTTETTSGHLHALPETRRLEALSDGTFAIIITLLVLEIHRPSAASGQLGAELLREGRLTSLTQSRLSIYALSG